VREVVTIDLSHVPFWMRNDVGCFEGEVESHCERVPARRTIEGIDRGIQVDDHPTCRTED